MSDASSSDPVADLKVLASLAARHGKGVRVDAAMALALVECAEVLRNYRGDDQWLIAKRDALATLAAL